MRILYHTDSLLRQVSRKPSPATDLFSLVENLKHAIRYEDKVWTGVGLSICGVQIGVPERVLIIGRPMFWDRGNHLKAFDVIIDPEVVSFGTKIVEEWEGCLSFPNLECLIPRHATITITYRNLLEKQITKEFGGTMSRVIQHEIDHLNAVLMTDRAISSRPKTPHR